MYDADVILQDFPLNSGKLANWIGGGSASWSSCLWVDTRRYRAGQARPGQADVTMVDSAGLVIGKYVAGYQTQHPEYEKDPLPVRDH